MNYRISTDLDEMDFDMLHGFLSQSYWSKDIPVAVLRKALENSLCFGIFNENKQLGFARMVTDRAIFAYLADVFILPEYQGQGLSKRLLDAVFAHPDLQGLRRVSLVTRDAHGLYEKYGFNSIKSAEMYMENWTPDIYTKEPKCE